MTLRNSYLIQRLEAPHSFDNPFNFGGGLRNGGLSKDAMDLLRPIFSFAYMGAAEYEFGDVPKSFARIAELANVEALSAFKVEILLSQVQPSWRDKTKPASGAKGTVYVIAAADLQDEVSERIVDMAKGEVDTKGGHQLNTALRPFSDYDRENIGGVDIRNDFIYFVDKDAFVKTCELFGVATDVS